MVAAATELAAPAAAAPALELAAPATLESNTLRNTSSAMPDLESPNVPSLKARVHQRLSAAECAKIPLSALHFRQLRPEDFDEMIALHTEWFPVSYDKNFYTKSVQGDFFTLVASHIPQPNEHSGLNWEGSTTSSCTPVEE